MHSETLLMTWTISPSKIQKWYQSSTLSSEIRKLQYFKSLLFYITQSNFWKIVFCENSDYKFNESEKHVIWYLSKLYDKEFELLSFKWDFEKTNEVWYWYWEWECIDYAIDNSKLLKNSNTFYKITWRYIIWNINQIIDLYKNDKNIFIRNNIVWYFSMNTAFFKMDKQLYKEFFYNAKKKVNNFKNLSFEVTFYTIIYENNLYKYNWKVKALPMRINYYDDRFLLSIHRINVIRRSHLRYDSVLLKLWIYSITNFDKLLFKMITPLTRKNKR